MQRFIAIFLAVVALMCGAAVQATAEPLVALATNNRLVSFDSAMPGTAVLTPVTGLAANDFLQGIDYRPTNGVLYGLAFNINQIDVRIYTINPLTGVAAFVSTLTPVPGLGVSAFGMDFNPVADTAGLPSLRVVTDAEQNLRVNVETGAVIVDGTITGAPGNPSITGIAYTNNFAGATSTTLYAIDATSDRLFRFTDPIAGTVVDVGPLGINTFGAVGFDISGVTGIAYAALTMVERPSMLYTINLATGQATLVGQIGTPGFTILGLTAAPAGSAVIPEPATIVLLGTGLLAVGSAVRQRRKTDKSEEV